jgi:hypothetical protein
MERYEVGDILEITSMIGKVDDPLVLLCYMPPEESPSKEAQL